MIVACTACKTRFEAAGYRDVLCPHCGSIAQQATNRPCPRCDLPLAAREVSDIVIDECTACHGMFLDQTAIHRVLDEEDYTRAEALLANTPAKARPFTGGRMYIKCPTCSTVMNRKLFATGSGVIVDVCKSHGTFFDAGELPAIIDFVRSGGLEIAAKKDAQRQAERDKRDRAEAERVRNMPTTVHTPSGDERGSALIDFLHSLFD
ncbi:MAG TPA: zf-TFIIB domain-containing protein [Kofleriaceae bacterium]